MIIVLTISLIGFIVWMASGKTVRLSGLLWRACITLLLAFAADVLIVWATLSGQGDPELFALVAATEIFMGMILTIPYLLLAILAWAIINKAKHARR